MNMDIQIKNFGFIPECLPGWVSDFGTTPREKVRKGTSGCNRQ